MQAWCLKNGRPKDEYINLTYEEKLFYKAIMEDEIEKENKKIELIGEMLGVKI